MNLLYDSEELHSEKVYFTISKDKSILHLNPFKEVDLGFGIKIKILEKRIVVFSRLKNRDLPRSAKKGYIYEWKDYLKEEYPDFDPEDIVIYVEFIVL